MSTLNSIRDTFFEECEDLMADLADGLAKMQSGSADPETVNAVFRAVHSVKGGAGAFSLTELVAFSHQFETVLDELRADRLQLQPELMFTLLRSADHLTVLIEAARDGVDVDSTVTQNSAAALRIWLKPSNAAAEAPASAEDSFSFAAVTLDFGAFDPPSDTPHEPQINQYNIMFQPTATLFSNGHEPALLFGELARLGTVSSTIDLADLPNWEEFDTTVPFIKWHLKLSSAAEIDQVRAVFEFVDGLCKLDITTAQMPADEVPIQVEASPPPAPTPPPIREAVVEPIMPAAQMPSTAAKAAAVNTQVLDQHGPKPTLRVELDRVDRLINAVGELIINQAMIAQRVNEMPVTTDTEVVTYVEDYRL